MRCLFEVFGSAREIFRALFYGKQKCRYITTEFTEKKLFTAISFQLFCASPCVLLLFFPPLNLVKPLTKKSETKKKNKSLIKPQNYTENTKLFNFELFFIKSFCGATAESRNCFHIHVLRYILPLDPTIKSQDDQ